MNNWTPIEGNALSMPSGPQGDHLFVISGGPYRKQCYPGAQYILVPLCTVSGTRYDTACLIQPGEHRFVTRLTYVLYSSASIRSESDLCAGINNGIFRLDEDVTELLLLRIQDGLRNSKHVARFIKKDFLS